MSETEAVAADPDELIECRGEGGYFPRKDFTLTQRFGLVHTTDVDPPHTLFGDPVSRAEVEAPEDSGSSAGGGGGGGSGVDVMLPDADTDDPNRA